MQLPDNVYAAVMAAGESTRFGDTKQLVDVSGESLVRRACRVADGVCTSRTLLVVGHDWRRVLASSEHSYFIINENYRSGLGGSIAAAAEALRHTAASLLVMLADQVAITGDELRQLIALHRQNPDGIAVSRYAGALGPPAIFPARAFDDLAALDESDGAKNVIRSGHYPVAILDCENALLDIDRPDDLKAFNDLRRSKQQG